MQVSGRIVAHSESISSAFVPSSDPGGHLAVLVGSPRCDLECGGDEPKVRLGRYTAKWRLLDGKATFHSKSEKAPELFAQPQHAVHRAGKFYCDHMRVFPGARRSGIEAPRYAAAFVANHTLPLRKRGSCRWIPLVFDDEGLRRAQMDTSGPPAREDSHGSLSVSRRSRSDFATENSREPALILKAGVDSNLSQWHVGLRMQSSRVIDAPLFHKGSRGSSH
jgi:hypothetical protein